MEELLFIEYAEPVRESDDPLCDAARAIISYAKRELPHVSEEQLREVLVDFAHSLLPDDVFPALEKLENVDERAVFARLGFAGQRQFADAMRQLRTDVIDY